MNSLIQMWRDWSYIGTTHRRHAIHDEIQQRMAHPADVDRTFRRWSRNQAADRKYVGTLIASFDRTGLRDYAPMFTVTDKLREALRERMHLDFCRDCNTFQRDEEHSDGSFSEDGDFVCYSCACNYIYSDIEDCYVHEDEAVKVWSDSESYEWCSRDYARNNYETDHDARYVTSSYYEELCADGYAGDQDEDEDEDAPIQGSPHTRSNYGNKDPFDYRNPCVVSQYHSSSHYIQKLPSPVADKAVVPLRVGLELEIELDRKYRGNSVAYYTAAQALKRLLNHGTTVPVGDVRDKYALIERDGSVQYGFEVVTGYTGLDTHERILGEALRSDEFKQWVKTYDAKSHDTDTCGMHITIDRNGITPLHKAKMVVFANHPGNRGLIEAVCRRYAQGYCKIKADDFAKLGRVHHMHANNDDRYEILNFTKDKVIEFRGPRGTLKFETIMATLEFTRLLWMFTEQAAAGNLTTDAFIDYVWRPAHASESKYLRPYLIQRKVAPAETRSLDATRRLTITESLADALEMGFISAPVDR